MKNINEIIIDAYIKIKTGAKQFNIETERGTFINAYRVGTIIRIDIKEMGDEYPELENEINNSQNQLERIEGNQKFILLILKTIKKQLKKKCKQNYDKYEELYYDMRSNASLESSR